MRKLYYLFVLTLLFPISSFAFIQGYEATGSTIGVDGFYCPSGGTHNSQPVFKTEDDVNWLYYASYGGNMYWVIGDDTLTDAYGSNWFIYSNTLNNTNPLTQSTWSTPATANVVGTLLTSYDCEVTPPEPPATTTPILETGINVFIFFAFFFVFMSVFCLVIYLNNIFFKK